MIELPPMCSVLTELGGSRSAPQCAEEQPVVHTESGPERGIGDSNELTISSINIWQETTTDLHPQSERLHRFGCDEMHHRGKLTREPARVNLSMGSLHSPSPLSSHEAHPC